MRFIHHIDVGRPDTAVQLLAAECELSKVQVKKCLAKGAVWLNRSGRKEQRIRKAKFAARPGDRISLFYDEQILSATVPAPACIAVTPDFSVWNKPPGMLSQGSRYGDHCSLLRFVQRDKRTPETIYLLHRLDREAHGLVMLAHHKQAAAALSNLFRQGKIRKKYRATASGLLAAPGETLRLTTPLDGKHAVTVITVRSHDTTRMQSHLDIDLFTGRYHQIRRHLLGAGCPIVGDYRYGQGKSSSDLLLCAYELEFENPLKTGQKERYTLERDPAISGN